MHLGMGDGGGGGGWFVHKAATRIQECKRHRAHVCRLCGTGAGLIDRRHNATHTHTHTRTLMKAYSSVCMCACVCVCCLKHRGNAGKSYYYMRTVFAITYRLARLGGSSGVGSSQHVWHVH